MNLKKKNILLVSSFLPYPLNVGGKIRIYKLCKLLSSKYNFILLSLINNPREIDYIPQLRSVFSQIYLVLERSLPKSLLYPVSYFGSYSKALIKKFTEIIKDNCIDLVHIESNELLYLTGFCKNKPILYTEHDISSLFLADSHYPYYGIFDYLKRVHFHWHFYKRLDGIIVLSEKDGEFVKRFVKDKNIYYLPTGVDLGYFYFNKRNHDSNKLIFVGWYLHYPNEDAIVYFIERIFPLIKNKISNIELLVVGSDPTIRIQNLSRREGVNLIGPVKDIRRHLDSAGVFVSPIRYGSGIKTKVLEAMANGLPVVATHKGIEGIYARDGEEVLISDSPRGFAERVIGLFFDLKLRDKLSQNARRLVEEKYDFTKIAGQLEVIYKNVLTIDIGNTPIFNITL